MQTSSSSGSAALDAMPPLLLRVTNVLAYVALITVNVLSGLNVFGPSQADVSKTYSTPLTPAGWAFSIWGVIFGLQGAAVLYAAAPAGYQMHWKRAAVNSLGYGWQLTWLCEASWLVLFPRQTALSFVACAALLLAGFGCIFATLRRLHALVLLPGGSRGASWPLTNPLLHLLYLLPTSLNAAWMSVASCLGLAVLAASQGVSDPHQRVLAALLAGVVSAGGVLLVLQTLDVPYGLTIAWALLAISQAQQHVPLVRLLAELALAAVLLACGCAVWKQHQLSRAWDDSSSSAAAMQESLLQAPPSGGGGGGVGSSSGQ